jgi:hypothetical protein
MLSFWARDVGARWREGRKTIKTGPVFKKFSWILRSKGQKVCGLDLKGTPPGLYYTVGQPTYSWEGGRGIALLSGEGPYGGLSDEEGGKCLGISSFFFFLFL